MHTTKVIDVTPTWSGILPALMMLLESPSAEARQTAKDELLRMAKLADRQMAWIEAND